MSKRDESSMPLLNYADELVGKLRELLPAAVKDHDESAIHQSRVATRRLKAAADVFEAISTRSHRRDFVKTLRKLRRHLGPARDLDVMIGHVKQIKTGRFKPGADWLLEQLQTQQRDMHDSESESLDVARALARLGAWWGVRQDWAEAQDGLDCLIGESLHIQLDTFAEYADAISGRRIASDEMKTLDPHQVRIAGKALRYTLEMATAGKHRIPAKVSRTFKHMQDALGLWHDFVVLNDCILKLTVESQLAHCDPARAVIVLDISRQAVTRSAKELSRFNKLWIARGEDLAQSIRYAFPLTQSVEPDLFNGLRMDPDPSDSASASVADAPPQDPPAEVPGETSTV